MTVYSHAIKHCLYLLYSQTPPHTSQLLCSKVAQINQPMVQLSTKRQEPRRTSISLNGFSAMTLKAGYRPCILTALSGSVWSVVLSWSAGERVSGRYMALDKISNEVGISWFRWRSNHYKCNTQNKSSTFERFYFFTAQMKHTQSSKYFFFTHYVSVTILTRELQALNN